MIHQATQPSASHNMTYKDPTKPETTTESEIYHEDKKSSGEPEVKWKKYRGMLYVQP